MKEREGRRYCRLRDNRLVWSAMRFQGQQRFPGHSKYILARVVGPTGNQITSWCHVTDADCVPVSTAEAGGAVGGCFQGPGRVPYRRRFVVEFGWAVELNTR